MNTMYSFVHYSTSNEVELKKTKQTYSIYNPLQRFRCMCG